ncbi:hypothetical protein S820908_056 [Synechococcus phage S-CAM9]|uniref:Uncharacterized protein n=1 Tax=Synechococcus phage S-CAM9 TaxID=1883369 RepID=A0A1D8KP51_9CAUD|nr:hypothetical protein BOW85_gp193 [Synechococcus phage S-CAM9]AOV60204.1 hypothetical protein S050808_057 [Synechococcus phage S-CAM9]AOV60431.1 hypothetical protein S820908_056 [Synechococcus phage S-CAM9]AOV60659.1 hypothetical protein N161109_056 [Synechococcus phage S-CAM9]
MPEAALFTNERDEALNNNIQEREVVDNPLEWNESTKPLGCNEPDNPCVAISPDFYWEFSTDGYVHELDELENQIDFKSTKDTQIGEEFNWDCVLEKVYDKVKELPFSIEARSIKIESPWLEKDEEERICNRLSDTHSLAFVYVHKVPDYLSFYNERYKNYYSTKLLKYLTLGEDRMVQEWPEILNIRQQQVIFFPTSLLYKIKGGVVVCGKIEIQSEEGNDL